MQPKIVFNRLSDQPVGYFLVYVVHCYPLKSSFCYNLVREDVALGAIQQQNLASTKIQQIFEI